MLRDLQADLADLTDAVSAVESDPYAFGLQVEEVRRRRRLVGDVGDEIARMQQELQRTPQPVHGKAKGAANGSMLPDPDAFDEHGDDDYAAAFEQQRQEELLHEQDDIMEGVSQTVGNLRQQADVFGRELDEQGQILEDVDHAADRVGRKLQTGMRRIGEVIKRNEGRVLKLLRTLLTARRHLVELLYWRFDCRFGRFIDSPAVAMKLYALSTRQGCDRPFQKRLTHRFLPRMAEDAAGSHVCEPMEMRIFRWQ